MAVQCSMCLGGILCGRALYSAVGAVTMCDGGVLYFRAVYCMVGKCTLW